MTDNPYTSEKLFWQQIAQEFTEKTQQLWHDGWFRDYDTVRGIWSSERDIMHLAPLFCQIATAEQIKQVRPIFTNPPAHSTHWAPLSWPPVVLTLIGAAVQAQMREEAVELAARYITASYSSTDRRELDEDGGLPGITREYLRTVTSETGADQEYANAGIEGYGWGALSIHLIMYVLFGLQAVQVDRVRICPMLPEKLRRVGAVYRITSLPWGKCLLTLECLVKDAHTYQMLVQAKPYLRATASMPEQQQSNPSAEGEQQCVWEAAWGEGREVQLPQLTLSALNP